MRDEPSSQSDLAIIWLILGGLALAFVLVYTWPHNVSRPVSNRVKSASNLRQIGLAIMQYSNDNAGVFPDSFKTLLITQDITSPVFISPASNDTPAEGPTAQAQAAPLIPG